MKPAEGKLGVMAVGLGAVTTTFIVGTMMYRKNKGLPGGSVTQMAKIRVGRGENRRYLKMNEIVSMTAAIWNLPPGISSLKTPMKVR